MLFTASCHATLATQKEELQPTDIPSLASGLVFVFHAPSPPQIVDEVQNNCIYLLNNRGLSTGALMTADKVSATVVTSSA